MSSQVTESSLKPSLYKVIETEDTSKFLVAYRSITLVPFDQQGKDGWDPVDGSVRVTLPEGHGENTKSNIILQAEDIHIYAGSTFNFPGKHVTIIGGRIIAEQGPDPQATRIFFNCRGIDSKDVDGAPKQPDTARQNTFDNNSGAETIVQGTAGTKGNDNATPGQDGGSLIISGVLVCKTNIDVQLAANCSGGNGGRGQKGGQGGQGAAGANTYVTAPTDHYASDQVKNGTDGGRGGDGGSGSAGGHGGFIFNLTTQYTPAISSNSFKVEASNEDVVAGNFGGGGEGGSGDAGGAQGKNTINRQIGRIGPFGIPYYIWEEEYHDGVAGSSGQKGTNGAAGPNTARTGCVFQDKTQSGRNPIVIGLIDGLRVSLLMQRLMFEYQMIFCSQVPSISQTPADDFQDSFSHLLLQIWFVGAKDDGVQFSTDFLYDMASFGRDEQQEVVQKVSDWLNSTIRTPWLNRKDTRLQLLTSFKLFLVNTQPGRNLDVFGQKLNYISRPNLALSDLNKALTRLGQLEEERDKIVKQLEDDAAARKKSSATAGSLKDIIAGYEDDRKELLATLKECSATVLDAKTALRDQQTIVNKDLDQFWSAVKKAYACNDVLDVLRRVTTILSLAGPEMEPVAEMATKIGDLGDAFGLDELLKPYGELADKGAVQKTIRRIQEDQSSDKLQEQISKLTQGMEDPTDKESFVDTLLADRDAFNTLITDKFTELRQAAGVGPEILTAAQQAFDDLIVKAQLLQTAATKCTDTVLSIAKLAEDQKAAESNIAELQNQNLDPSLPLLDLVVAFYNRLYTFQKASTIKFMFDVIRACNGLFLQKSTIANDFLRFGTFDDVTATQMSLACTTRLAADVDKFLTLYNKYPIFYVYNRRAIFTPDKHPTVFASLKNSGNFTISFSPSNVANYFTWNNQWYDIRLADLQIFLTGATNKKASADADSQIVDVNISIGNRFSVINLDNTEHVFSVPEYNTGFAYNYSKEKPEAVTSTSLPTHSNFVIQPDLVADTKLDKSYPMRSPFMTFSFSASSNVDVSNVSEIILALELRVRDRGGLAKDVGERW